MNDMPKLQSPFVRKEINGKYVCTPEIRSEYRWVFSDRSIATDKLDGTNVSLWIENGRVKNILNRLNIIDIWKKGQTRFAEGILNAISKGYIDEPKRLKDDSYFGELIGESVQGNPYKLQGHIWIPFKKIKTNYIYKFWFEFVKELEGKSDKEIYNKVSELFKGLWSLFKRNYCKIKGNVNENTVFEGAASEGIVFYHKDKMGYSHCAKLRRDMFDWYKGNDHQTYHG